MPARRSFRSRPLKLHRALWANYKTGCRPVKERAAHALDNIPRTERDISCLTLCISEAKLDEIKQRVRQFRQELLQAAERDDQPGRVVQINFQVFPLSKPTGKAP